MVEADDQAVYLAPSRVISSPRGLRPFTAANSRWRRAPSTKDPYANGKVDWIAQARWVEDRDRWTSSGVAAGMDMAAALLADLFGKDVAHRATTLAELEVHEDASWDPFARIYGLAE